MVVLANLALDIGTSDTGIGGQRLVHPFVFQFPADVLGSRKLVVKGKQFFLVLCRLGQIEIGSGLHVRQQVFGFIRRDILIHMPQLVLNHTKTVADELGGADSNLVLVLNPFLIIDFNQGIEDVFRLLDGGILNAEIDNSGILVAEFRTEFLCLQYISQTMTKAARI